MYLKCRRLGHESHIRFKRCEDEERKLDNISRINILINIAITSTGHMVMVPVDSICEKTKPTSCPEDVTDDDTDWAGFLLEHKNERDEEGEKGSTGDAQGAQPIINMSGLLHVHEGEGMGEGGTDG